MRKIILHPGQRFGKWTILKDVASGSSNSTGRYLCECDCGTVREVASYSLRMGLSSSCRCHMTGNTRHGLCRHPLFRVWGGMKERCYRPSSNSFQYYGAKGIAVCDAWRIDFRSFYRWAVTHGYRRGLTIERIDNDGNYEPSNCRWATTKEQARNCRRNHLVTYQGKTLPIVVWCDELGLKYDVIKQRLTKLKWTPKRAFTTPVRTLRIRRD